MNHVFCIPIINQICSTRQKHFPVNVFVLYRSNTFLKMFYRMKYDSFIYLSFQMEYADLYMVYFDGK